jgi:methyltransferase (TIGR00027 family)
MRNHQPSRTAEYMALFRAVETTEHPSQRLFEDPFAVAFLSGTLKALAQIARLPVIGRIVRVFLDFGWPYTRSSGIVRTRLIDDMTRESLHGGIKQFLLLGAGFDSRAYRLDEATGARIFEVDHPATQKAKRERLKSHFGLPTQNVQFIEMDFEKDNVESKLKEAGFDDRIPSIVLWEGVVSYLSEPAVETNLALLSRLLAPNSRLILTYVHKGVLDGSENFRGSRRWKWWVRRSGEPFIFGFDSATLASALAHYGFEIRSDESTADAAKRYFTANRRKESGSEWYRVASVIRSGA